MDGIFNVESTRILGCFCKQPIPGQVKTRLARETSPAWAGRVAHAFCLDVLDRMRGISACRLLAYAPKEADAHFRAVVASGFQLHPQADGDLGQRMAAFFAHWLPSAPDGVVLIGTDSPTLPTSFIEQAFAALQDADVVLGPATDGGYYLIGCRGRVPAVFDGIAWGTRSVLAETVQRLESLDVRLALLPPWYDVDTLDDWKMLVGHVAAMRRAGLDPGVPHTEQLLHESP